MNNQLLIPVAIGTMQLVSFPFQALQQQLQVNLYNSLYWLPVPMDALLPEQQAA
jgi:hypothetical protein